jgi:hypothetical protein
MKDVRFIAEKHRAAQQYFAGNQEVVQTPNYEKIIEDLEEQSDSERYSELADQAQKELEKKAGIQI